MVLALMAMATVALAGPGANSPWEPMPKGEDTYCSHPSDPTSLQSGMWYYNNNSDNYHCFKI